MFNLNKRELVTCSIQLAVLDTRANVSSEIFEAREYW